QTGRVNRRRRGVEQGPVLGGSVEVPGRDAIARRMRDIKIGAGLRGLEVMRVAAVLIYRGEAVHSPAQAAGPAGIATITLTGGLGQEFSGIGVKNLFVSGGAIAPHQHAPRGPRMAQ